MGPTNPVKSKLCVISISFPVTDADQATHLGKQIEELTKDISPVRVDVRTVSQRGQPDGS